MLKKDEIKIENELIKLIQNILQNEYRDPKGKPIDTIEKISIINVEYDTENQDRKKIIIKEVIADTRLHIQFMEGSTSSLNTQFINNKPIEFKINTSTDEVELIDSDVKFLEKKIF